jgi:MFS family permease
MFKKILLVLNTLTFASTQILLFTLLPILSEKLSVSLSVIIGCFSLGSFLFLWGAPYWSSKSDKVGRDQIMNVGLIGLTVSFFLLVVLFHFSLPLGETITFAVLIFSRILYGALASAIVPVAQLKNADLAKEGEHISGMFSHSLALNVGRSIGPLLLLLGKDHLDILLLSLSAWSFFLLIMNIFTSTKQLATHKDIASSLAGVSEWKLVAKKIWLPLLLTILFTSYTGILHSSLGHTLEKVFTLSAVEASTLMAKVLLLGSLAMVVTQIIGKLALKKKVRLTLVIGFLALVSGAMTLAFMNNTIQMAVAIVMISIGIALIYPSHLALVHANYPKESMGKNIGLLSSGNTIGYALGGAMASLFINHEIHKIALVLIVLLCAVAVMNTKEMKL